MNKKIALFFLIATIGLFLRMLIVFLPSQGYLIQLTSDDFYISMQIMRTWVEQGMISFDGLVWTNGFHPLYYFILYPIFKLFSGIFPYDKMALVVLFLFDVLTSIFIYKIVRLYRSAKIARLSAYFWLFNPGTIFIVLLGVESAFVGFFFSAFIYSFLKFKKQNSTGNGHLILLSFLYGLLFLTRTEFILLGPFLYLDIIHHLKKKNNLSTGRTLKKVLLSGAISLITVAPWLIYGHFYVGSFLQDSGSALVQLTHSEFNANPSIGLFLMKTFVFSTKYILKLANNLGSIALFGVMLALLIKNKKVSLRNIPKKILYSVLFFSLVLSFLIPETIVSLSENLNSIILMTLIFLISFSITFLLVNNPKENNLPLRDGWIFVAFLISHFLFYVTYFWLIQAWYLFSVITLFTIFLVQTLFAYLTENRAKILILILFLFLIIKTVILFSNPTMPWHLNHLEGARWLNENTPPESIIGATDAGIIAYFSERTTLNLDGLVNKEAYLAAKENRLNEYVLNSNTSYIFGNKLNVPGFEPIITISANPQFNQTIWKNKNSQQ